MADRTTRSEGTGSALVGPPDRVPLWLPALACAVIAAARSGLRALWLDEAFTAYASTLSWADLRALVDRMDAVHATYYALMHGWLDLVGYSLPLLRLPSALFMGLACLGITLIARDLCGRRCALLTGFTFAVLPVVVTMGAEARSLALSTALATWATWAFLRALHAGASWRHWTLYTVLLTCTGYVFVIAWLVVVAHLAVLITRSRSASAAWRPLLAQAVSFLLLLPLLERGRNQQGQVAWIQRDTVASLKTTFDFTLSTPTRVYPLLVAACYVLVVGASIASLRRRHDPGRIELLALAWAWLVGPGLVLTALAFWVPLFNPRYITFCAPALALLLGMSLELLPRPRLTLTAAALAAAIVLILVSRDGRQGQDNWQGKYDLLAAEARPGDAVIASPRWYEVVPRFAGLPPGVALLELPDSYTKARHEGTPLTTWAQHPRTIWVVPFAGYDATDGALQALASNGYVRTGEFRVDDKRVVLRYEPSANPG